VQHIGKLNTDSPSPGDDDAGRQSFRQDEFFIGDDAVTQLRTGDQAGGCASRQNDILKVDVFRLAAFQLDLQIIRPGEFGPAVIAGDLVLLHEELHAFGQAARHLTAALVGDRVIHADLALDVNAEYLPLI